MCFCSYFFFQAQFEPQYYQTKIVIYVLLSMLYVRLFVFLNFFLDYCHRLLYNYIVLALFICRNSVILCSLKNWRIRLRIWKKSMKKFLYFLTFNLLVKLALCTFKNTVPFNNKLIHSLFCRIVPTQGMVSEELQHLCTACVPHTIQCLRENFMKYRCFS